MRILIVDDHEHIGRLVHLLVEAEEGWVTALNSRVANKPVAYQSGIQVNRDRA
jgi:hypothetical protein